LVSFGGVHTFVLLFWATELDNINGGNFFHHDLELVEAVGGLFTSNKTLTCWWMVLAKFFFLGGS
jgi:hypothetical protein